MSLALSLKLARADVDLVGARVGTVGSRVFFAKSISLPVDPALEELNRADNRWFLRDRGTDPLRFERDCGDPSSLARLIASYHDYPIPGYFSHSLTD